MGNWTDSAKLPVHKYVLLYFSTYKNIVCYQTINSEHCIVRVLAVNYRNEIITGSN